MVTINDLFSSPIVVIALGSTRNQQQRDAGLRYMPPLRDTVGADWLPDDLPQSYRDALSSAGDDADGWERTAELLEAAGFGVKAERESSMPQWTQW